MGRKPAAGNAFYDKKNTPPPRRENYEQNRGYNREFRDRGGGRERDYDRGRDYDREREYDRERGVEKFRRPDIYKLQKKANPCLQKCPKQNTSLRNNYVNFLGHLSSNGFQLGKICLIFDDLNM